MGGLDEGVEAVEEGGLGWSGSVPHSCSQSDTTADAPDSAEEAAAPSPTATRASVWRSRPAAVWVWGEGRVGHTHPVLKHNVLSRCAHREGEVTLGGAHTTASTAAGTAAASASSASPLAE